MEDPRRVMVEEDAEDFGETRLRMLERAWRSWEQESRWCSF